MADPLPDEPRTTAMTTAKRSVVILMTPPFLGRVRA
jgi:hypothetical protein